MNKRASAIVACAVAACGVTGAVLAAGPDPVSVARMMDWWMNKGGPALQRSLGHRGFRAARPSVPAWLENTTDDTVNFIFETKTCDWSKNQTLGPGEGAELSCQTTSGDNGYNVRFDNGNNHQTKLRLNGGDMAYFVWEDGQLRLFRYIPEG